MGNLHRIDDLDDRLAGRSSCASRAPHHYQALPAFAPEISDGPKVKLPNRAYLLFGGPLDAVDELGAWVSWIPDRATTFERATPSLWWPDDHAWCAANEIDASFTCVGGSRSLIDELLRHPGLETLELHPDAQPDEQDRAS
jgi:hypothetical protein